MLGEVAALVFSYYEEPDVNSVDNFAVLESKITIRRAGRNDLAFVSQDRYVSESKIIRKIQDGDVFIAIVEEEQVGYLRLEYLWSRLPYVELIRVLEPHRRLGVGKALLSFVATEAANQGHAALYSSSQADEPEPQAWHRRVGFEECGILVGVNEGGIGEVFFRKLLEPTKGPV